MNYLIDKYLQKLSKEYKDSKEVLAFCRVVMEKGHFNASSFYERLQSDTPEQDKPIDWDKQLLKYHKFKDYRVRNIIIKNFRKYGSKKDFPYLIDLIDNSGKCSSIFVVGKNGTGKTSIFNALEYAFNIPYISSMAVRGITKQERYLPYGDKKITDINISVELNSQINKEYVTVTSTKNSRKKWSQIDLSSFFCSEKDIQEIYKQHNLKDIYINNLGLHYIESLIDELERDLRIETEQELEFPIVEYKTFNTETLQNDILRISCQGYEGYKRFLGQIGLITGLLKKNLVNKDNSLERYQKFQANRDLIIIIGDFFEKNKLLTSLDYFTICLPQIKNYVALTSLDGIELLRALGSLDKMIDFDILVDEMIIYLDELRAPFQQANVSDTSALNSVARLTLENTIRRSGSELKKAILKRNQNYSVPISEDKIRTIIINFRNSLKDYYKDDCADILEGCNKFVAPLLNKFTQISNTTNNNEIITILERENEFYAEISSPDVSDSYKTRPHFFYNNFRYKLFAISVKISLALMMMKKYNIIAPIIIDDVFTASDFDNTVNIDLFFEQLSISFKDVVGKDADKLQVILFTHDEVVLNGLRDVFQSINIPLVLGRLLNTSELLPEDYDEKSNSYKLIERFI